MSSRWSEFGFTDGILLANPALAMRGLFAALYERETFAKLPNNYTFTPVYLSSVSTGIFDSFDKRLDAISKSYIDLDSLQYTTPYKWTGIKRLAQYLNEDLIKSGNPLSPIFSMEWALQRYRMLNLLMIVSPEFAESKMHWSKPSFHIKNFSRYVSEGPFELVSTDFNAEYQGALAMIEEASVYLGGIHGYCHFLSDYPSGERLGGCYLDFHGVNSTVYVTWDHPFSEMVVTIKVVPDGTAWYFNPFNVDLPEGESKKTVRNNGIIFKNLKLRDSYYGYSTLPVNYLYGATASINVSFSYDSYDNITNYNLGSVFSF